MSDRCIVAVRFTPAGSLRQVGKAVGGFLRYVQHRDVHAAEPTSPATRPEVAGLLKYVAYRDRASARAELFGADGTMGSAERKAFAAFVQRSLQDSRPQLYRGRSGDQVDRRRAVYRLVISPEHAAGLDLRRLTAAAIAAIESDVAGDQLRWMAAIHRNTAHPHVHLVIAGMRETAQGFRRFDLTKPRLAAIKLAVANELARQRSDRRPALVPAQVSVAALTGLPPNARDRVTPRPHSTLRSRLPAPRRTQRPEPRTRLRQRIVGAGSSPLLRVRAAARRYVAQLEAEAARDARQRGWEYAA